MLTRMTARLIQDDPEAYASAYGPMDGKYGIYIGTYDETPSGSKRPRDLLTSEPIYATAEEAKAAAEKIIQEVRESDPAFSFENKKRETK